MDALKELSAMGESSAPKKNDSSTHNGKYDAKVLFSEFKLVNTMMTLRRKLVKVHLRKRFLLSSLPGARKSAKGADSELRSVE